MRVIRVWLKCQTLRWWTISHCKENRNHNNRARRNCEYIRSFITTWQALSSVSSKITFHRFLLSTDRIVFETVLWLQNTHTANKVEGEGGVYGRDYHTRRSILIFLQPLSERICGLYSEDILISFRNQISKIYVTFPH